MVGPRRGSIGREPGRWKSQGRPGHLTEMEGFFRAALGFFREGVGFRARRELGCRQTTVIATVAVVSKGLCNYIT